VITPGQKIIDAWIENGLISNEFLAPLETGFTNNSIIMQYLDHLIKHTNAGPNKAWQALLLDGHKSHHYLPFQLKAIEHYIKLVYFPSHLTHIL
jgi:hypothetical protein